LTHSNAEKFKTELQGIKAPLGVIFYLIKRDNLDIYDIPIARIVKDYLDYLNLMEKLQIDLAGEFFVLAATLMRIKVQMLLRRDDGEEDPRDELVRDLVEYRKMVEAARSFQSMEEERLKVFTRPVPQHEKEYRGEPEFELSLYEIMRAFVEIAAGFESEPTTEIVPETYTIEQKIEVILASLAEEEPVRFRDLFAGLASRLEVIVTFVAVLELIKRLAISVRQETLFGEIWIYRTETVSEPVEEVSNS
jgi:segregation and condensation protein A